MRRSAATPVTGDDASVPPRRWRGRSSALRHAEAPARLVHPPLTVRTSLVAMALLIVGPTASCGTLLTLYDADDECYTWCHSQFDRCEESGAPHGECHAQRDECFASCPP
jgi:hypothetical protein